MERYISALREEGSLVELFCMGVIGTRQRGISDLSEYFPPAERKRGLPSIEGGDLMLIEGDRALSPQGRKPLFLGK